MKKGFANNKKMNSKKVLFDNWRTGREIVKTNLLFEMIDYLFPSLK